VPVRRASADHPLDAVGPSPALVVATPGSEPVAEGGYAAVLLLDTWLPLSRPDLRSAEEAVRRWFNAAALARTAADGGRVVAVGDPSAPALQALVRWDPAGFAAREAAERRAAHLPPASRLAVITGVADDVEAFLVALELPLGAEVLGPVEETGRLAPQSADDEPVSRVVVRVPRRYGGALSDALRSVQGVRSARKLPLVRVQIDPPALA
jgi:primosomal protein N' (replication factor Y)